MSATYPVDPAMAVREANQSDLVRRKLDMDALRKRLGDQAGKEEKLRESCEGFEAIFLQKMWEQMRKTVPKEGYLHSKDEETYQSLFDIELCKKMASAGGIGLA
ncbi:rod-binding protein, partial [Desulfovibrio sp. OttesenSCG-928-F20]|nr:rod-binding protein [Desulfovibrio sp. OttesenSCG-928-F20]